MNDKILAKAKLSLVYKPISEKGFDKPKHTDLEHGFDAVFVWAISTFAKKCKA